MYVYSMLHTILRRTFMKTTKPAKFSPVKYMKPKLRIINDNNDNNTNCVLHGSELNKLTSYTKFFNKQNYSLSDFYKQNDAHSSILPLVSLDNKSFGSLLEDIIRERFGLEKSTHSSYDASLNGIKFEQKSSRYWRTLGDFKWQHVMKDHPYDILILIAIDFQSIKVYTMTKTTFLELINKNIVKQQGGAEGQGYWFTRNKVRDYLTEIKTKEQFLDFIRSTQEFIRSTQVI